MIGLARASGLLSLAALSQGSSGAGSGVGCNPAASSGYNCSLPGLERLTPGIYQGVAASYLSFATETSSPYFKIRAVEFEKCTGGDIRFAEANNVFVDPMADLGTRGDFGLGVHDGYFMSYSHFPEASSLDLAETLNDRLKASQEYMQWEDVFPQVRAMGQYRKNGNNDLDFLMFDGDFFVPIVRLDLLEKENMPLPNTWDEVLHLAKFFHGKDLNADGQPDFGFCHFPRKDAGFWDWWWPELIYSTWATFAQTGPEGFFFDSETFEPLLDTPAFRKAARTWKSLWQYGEEGCITNNMATGRCAIGFSPPGCWKGIFLNGISRKDENGTVIWRPTMADGKYAEPYRLQPFGSTEVLNPATGKFSECTRKLCPKAKEVEPRGHTQKAVTGIDDRARVLPASPLAGKLINRAPFFWSGGLGTLIRKSAEPRSKDLLWDFFVYLNAPQTSKNDVAKYSSWIDSWRYSQLSPKGENFIQDGRWSHAAYHEHRSVMHASLDQEANGAMNLRIPGVKRYTAEVLGGAMQEFINGSLTEDGFVREVLRGWSEINAAKNVVHQLRTYRAALGLSEINDAQMCKLHRQSMDVLNPAICRAFDPKDDRVYLYVLIGVGAFMGVTIVGAFLLWVALTVRSKRRLLAESKKRQQKMVKDSLDTIGTLKFPMVLTSAKVFFTLGQFVSHENLRDRGDVSEMKVIDLYEDLSEFLTRMHVIFLSHQWLAWTQPDPEGVQYSCAMRACKKLVKEKGWDMSKVFIWCDYMSIPQRCSAIQMLAISSLPVYSSKVSAFIVIAPTTHHAETDLECSVETYSRRAWCRAEVLSHALCKGIGNMYIANEAGMVPFGSDSKHVMDSVYVFDGDLTCCRVGHKGMETCDREKLVVPFLGLYSYVLHTLAWKREEMDESTKSFFDRIIHEKKKIFPEEFNFRKADGTTEKRKLFKGLLELMETEVKNTSEEHFEDFRTLVAICHGQSGDGSNTMGSHKSDLSGMSSSLRSGSCEVSPRFRNVAVDREDSHMASLASLPEVEERDDPKTPLEKVKCMDSQGEDQEEGLGAVLEEGKAEPGYHVGAEKSLEAPCRQLKMTL